MNCIIIEDQAPAQRILKKYIGEVDHLQLKATFSNAIEALRFLQTESIDLIFLDIHLPKISGMDFLKSIPHPPAVILTTAFPDYALESYELDVVDYLLKPFSFQRFVKAVSKVSKTPSPSPPNPPANTSGSGEVLFIKSGYEHVRLNTRDIQYIKSESDYTELFTLDKKYLSSNSLRHWLEKLDAKQFCQIHKSYIINVHQIVKVAGNQVFLKEKQSIPIGRAYKEHFVNQFLQGF